jgi:lipoyl(octanoyl) transferase
VASVIRLLPFALADGPANMAADETMLHSAAAGVASLRCYGWTTATLSLGYFQPAAVRGTDARLAALPWVRRPSGGASLVHHQELTYAIALPPGGPWHSREPWLERMHRIITLALAEQGLPGRVEALAGPAIKHGDVLCFQHYTAGDLLAAGKKITGSAQRRYRQALLQHGSILLAQSEHAPALPGIRELTGVELSAGQAGAALLQMFARETGWRLEAGDWTSEEANHARELADQKYSQEWWNQKR